MEMAKPNIEVTLYAFLQVFKSILSDLKIWLILFNIVSWFQLENKKGKKHERRICHLSKNRELDTFTALTIIAF